MSTKLKAPFGTWPSPLSADLLFARATELRRGLGRMVLDGDDLYWIEGRPVEGGRNVVCRRDSAGRVSEASPSGVSVRTRVHEYGGGDFCAAGGVLYYVDDADQGIRSLESSKDLAPRTLTPTAPETHDRHADLVFDARHGRILCVRERHVEGSEPENTLISVDPSETGTTLLASGADFYASPAPSPDGTRLAWLEWDHPNMPWDGCRLRLAELGPNGQPTSSRVVAGGADESIFQPGWSPDGTLYFVSDRSGWWNLYRWDGTTTHAVCPMAAEMAVPQWQFGESTYAFLDANTLIAAATANGTWLLLRIVLDSGTAEPIAVPHTDIGHVCVGRGKAYYRGAAPDRSAALVALDLVDGAVDEFDVPVGIELAPASISVPEAVRFPTTDDAVAHGFFYAPRNAKYEDEPGALPPLIVIGHGGPTAAATTALDLKIQFWTSRGFAVLDVNYRGSTGYGRAYRDALKGRWGIADVDDCVAGARFLVDQGRVDGERLVIRGSSAGGFTVLCALTFHDVFRAGASYYGISDLEALARDTHKFEAHYTDSLVGPYPERVDLYRERSPIHFVDRLSCPLIVLQGLQDKVVPPSQAEAVVEALRAKQLPVAYVTFPEEGHGFRDARNGRRALEAELSFYAQVFGFTPADELPPLAVENL